MITHQESQSSTYPLKNVNFVGGFTKNFGQAQNFFTPARFREEARGFLRLSNLMPTVGYIARRILFYV